MARDLRQSLKAGYLLRTTRPPECQASLYTPLGNLQRYREPIIKEVLFTLFILFRYNTYLNMNSICTGCEFLQFRANAVESTDLRISPY